MRNISYAIVLLTLTSISVHSEPMKPVYSDGDIVVTATKEGKSKLKSPESITKLTQKDIEHISPTHPADILNKVAGVYIANVGGEGHITSIRQPISTSGLYLYLEDGLPTRPAGFFNHNALYEINLPQAGALEVTKGPGSSLYGSEAIGGVINSITEPSPEKFEFKLNPEIGSYGWKRVLTSIGDYSEDLKTGFRLNTNITDNDGYQDNSDYGRQSVSLRTDSFPNDALAIKNIISYTNVNQSGVSGLKTNDYRNNPQKNYFHGDIGARDVYALRVSSEFNYEPNKYDAFTITPFFRDNEMGLMPSWQLTYAPEVWNTKFQSYGLLAKYRRNIPSIQTTVITGVDFDYSPSTNTVNDINAKANGGIYRDFTIGKRVYDFDANQLGISPYVHLEKAITQKLTASAGLRYDYFNMDYTDNLPSSFSTVQFNTGLNRNVTRLRPASGDTTYDQLSPKFGLLYSFNDKYSLYGNYRHSFRTPSATTLYRSSTTVNTDKLQPTEVDSFEIGTKGIVNQWLGYEVAVYHASLTNDVVSYFDTNNIRNTTNAGETTQKGIEISAFGKITEEVSYNLAGSYSKQEYDNFQYQCGSVNCNYAGYKVGLAPQTLGNASLRYEPQYIKGFGISAEWVHVGSYFTNEKNTAQYDGHDLMNVRTDYAVNDTVSLYANLLNVTNTYHSVYTSNTNIGTEYRPGLPFAVFGGFRLKLGK
jgi:iron complex outermembrane recepter protein